MTIFNSFVLFFVVYASFVDVLRANYVDVPGCPSLYNYDFETKNGQAPRCFCDNSTDTSDEFVQINCLYFSTLKDLSESMRRVVKAKKILTAIFIEHMIFANDGLPDDYFLQHKVQPSEISVTKCEGSGRNLILRNSTFRGLEKNLTKLTIKDCTLTTSLFPQSVKHLTSLRTLELHRCSIRSINVDDLKELTQLEYLDLSGNGILTVEENSFKNLKNLQTLKLGNRNSLNSTIFVEINKYLTNLIDLDLSENNISHLPKRILPVLQRLQTLNLANNNILVVKNETFFGLTNLKTLDLRVNLIQDIETTAFRDLNELEEIYLDGNYLSELDSNVWNLPNLTVFNVGYNNLPTLHAKNFQHLPNLGELDLRKNEELNEIDIDAFYGLTKLQHANFSNTNLTMLNGDLFRNTPNLHTLDLSNTRISSLDKKVFRRLKNLLSLSLATTKLKTLPEGVFDDLDQLVELDLSGNNWNCDSKLTWLSKWIVEKIRNNSTTTFTRLNDVACLEPDELRNKPLVRLVDARFPLETTEATTLEVTEATTTQNQTIADNSTNFNATTSTKTSIRPTNVTTPERNAVASTEALGVVGQSNNEGVSKGAIIITVVVVLAACITIGVVVGIVLTMKRRRKKSSRLTALKNNFNPSSTIGIEMCQRPESNRLSDNVDVVKEQKNLPTNGGGLYDEIMLQQNEKDANVNDDDDVEQKNGHVKNNFRDSIDSPFPPPPPSPHL